MKRPVGEEDEVGLVPDRIIKQPQELDSGVRGLVAYPRPWALGQTLLSKNFPILRPLLTQTRRRQHDDGAAVRIVQNDRRRYRQRYERLAHADFIGQDDAGLLGQTSQNLFRSARLARAVLGCDTVSAEIDVRT